MKSETDANAAREFAKDYSHIQSNVSPISSGHTSKAEGEALVEAKRTWST